MTPERVALKRAFGETIKGVGGLEAAATLCRVGKSALGDAQNVNCPDRWPPLDVIADLEPLARDREGWPHVTRWLCREMGGTFVALPEAAGDRGDFLRTAGELGSEAADVTRGICEALANDGRIDAREARGIRDQIAGAQAVLAALDEQMRNIIGGGL